MDEADAMTNDAQAALRRGKIITYNKLFYFVCRVFVVIIWYNILFSFYITLFDYFGWSNDDKAALSRES